MNELAKMLDSLAEPVYVLDDERRIIYCNRACREWTGCAAEELLGAECRYHSSPEATGAVAVAAALCPPPEVFSGRRITANVVLPSGDHANAERQVEFIPLGADQGQSADTMAAGAMAFVLPACAAKPAHDDASAAELHTRIQRFRRQFAERFQVERLLGESPAMRRVRAQVQAASARAGRGGVGGARGGGRPHVARAVHYASGVAASGPFVPLACALLDVELIGATVRALLKPKMPAPPQPASLLLDDADELPPAAQVELARLLAPADLPFRIISTARAPLAERDDFRNDLACRLSTIVIEVPPLNTRPADLPLVAQGLLEHVNALGEKQVGGFTSVALDRLAAYEWPGDVDELEAVVRESHARAETAEIRPRDLPPRLELAADAAAYPRKPDETIVLDEFLASVEQELIERAVERSKGNRAKAARLLGMTRARFYRRLVQLGLESADEEDLELAADENEETD